MTIISGKGAKFAMSQVDAKTVTFYDAGATSVYLGNAEGTNVRIVLQYQEVDPAGIAAWKELGVRTPEDFIPASWENGNTLIEAEAAKIGREVDVFLLADWGVKVYGIGVTAHGDTINERLDLVERFLRATTRGIKAMMEDPERAADQVLNFEPGMDRELLIAGIRNRERMDNKDFKITDEQIKATMDFIEKYYEPATKLTPEEIWDPKFVEQKD